MINERTPSGRWLGLIDIVADREADIVISDKGGINGSPINVTVSHFVWNDSLMA
jgi:hypothetical protein